MLRVAARRFSSSTRTCLYLPAAASDNPISGSADSFPFWTSSFYPYRGISSESLAPRNVGNIVPAVPPTVAAVKNPTSKISYDEFNHERYPPGDPSKRAFAYFVLSGGRFVYASLLRLLVLKLVISMSASKDVLAMASLEVDLSSIEPGPLSLSSGVGSQCLSGVGLRRM